MIHNHGHHTVTVSVTRAFKLNPILKQLPAVQCESLLNVAGQIAEWGKKHNLQMEQAYMQSEFTQKEEQYLQQINTLQSELAVSKLQHTTELADKLKECETIYANKLNDYQNQHSNELVKMQEQHSNQLAKYSSKAEADQISHAEQLEKLESDYKEQLTQLTNRLEQQYNIQLKNNATTYEAHCNTLQQQIANLNGVLHENTSELNKYKTSMQKIKQDIIDEHNTLLTQAVEKHKQQTELRLQEQKEQFDSNELRYKEQITTLKQTTDSITADYKLKINRLEKALIESRTEHTAALDRVREEVKSEYIKQIDELKKQTLELRIEHGRALQQYSKELDERYSGQISTLERRIITLHGEHKQANSILKEEYATRYNTQLANAELQLKKANEAYSKQLEEARQRGKQLEAEYTSMRNKQIEQHTSQVAALQEQLSVVTADTKVKIQEAREETTASYLGQIKLLEKQLTNLQTSYVEQIDKRIRELTAEHTSEKERLHAQWTERVAELTEQHSREMQRIEADRAADRALLQHTINQLEHINTTIKPFASFNTGTIQEKGQIGEEMVFSVITQLGRLPNYTVRLTRKIAKAGDAQIIYCDKLIICEVKNKKVITKDDIDKLLRDCAENKAAAGMLVSLQTNRLPKHNQLSSETCEMNSWVQTPQGALLQCVAPSNTTELEQQLKLLCQLTTLHSTDSATVSNTKAKHGVKVSIAFIQEEIKIKQADIERLNTLLKELE